MNPALESIKVHMSQAAFMSASDMSSRDGPGVVSTTFPSKWDRECFERMAVPEMWVMDTDDVAQ